MPSITVVIPTWKDNPYVRESISSVLRQDYPPDRLTAMIVVNGDDREYHRRLCSEYQGDRAVKILFTEKKGAGAARNFAVEHLSSDCVTFLDDDDLLTPGYLRHLAEHMDESVDIVCGGLSDYSENLDQANHDTYINHVLSRVRSGVNSDLDLIANQFSLLPAKLYRSCLFKTVFVPIREDVTNTEDVIFWCENIQRLTRPVYLCRDFTKEHYVRRLKADSLSRPLLENEFEFYGEERLRIIDILTKIAFSAETVEAKRFTLQRIKSQTLMMRRFFDRLSDENKERFRAVVASNDSPFLNRNFFAARKGIAFCHNFSPAVDASAYVATRRLAQIAELEGGVGWTVVSCDMSNCRKSDGIYKEFLADFQMERHVVVGVKAYFTEKASAQWGMSAFQWMRDEPAEVIYSRSLWAGSHIAAYFYKRAHPEVRWHAEFSDPIAMDTNNRPRPPSQRYVGRDRWLGTFWRDLEWLVYTFADDIIFTNENQREYMIRHCPDSHAVARARTHSRVMPHPVIDSRYCDLFRSAFEFPSDTVNVAFFGTFYAVRRMDDLLQILRNKRVRLYVFADNVKLPDTVPNDMKERIFCRPTVPYFEFLNICTKADYLIVSDVVFSDPACVPYMPSKVADYLASGTRILALINGNSPLASSDDSRIIKLQGNCREVIEGLTKRAEERCA